MNNVADDSKRAMNTVALLTDAFRRHLNQNICEHIPENSEERQQFANELLDHVIVVGGFCRDVLLNRKINDVNIIINLRELTKLQTNHLKKYHQKRSQQARDCRCAYWKRYLTKMCPSAGALNDEQKHNPEIQRMHNYNYIFNTKFWIDILRKDKRLDNCLSVRDVDSRGFVSCEIVNTVKFGNHDLNHQQITFVDTFNVDRGADHDMFDNDEISEFHGKARRASMSGMDIQSMFDQAGGLGGDDDVKANNKSRPEVDTEPEPMADAEVERKRAARGKKGRLNSMAITQISMEDLGNEFSGFGMDQDKGRAEYITLEIPIYSGKVRYKLLNYDFSMNTCILPLSNVVRLMEYNNDYDHSINGNQHNDALTWREVIENGLGECDGIEDCTQETIIRSPEHDHCSIEAHPTTFIFWRIVRWLIREPEFTLDRKLKAAQMKDFDNWLNQKWMSDADNCNSFMTFLKRTLEKECTKIEHVEQMLAVMDDLRFHKKFVAMMPRLPDLQKALVSTLSSVDNPYLLNERIAEKFMDTPYSYPHLPIVAIVTTPKILETDASKIKEYLQMEERNKEMQTELERVQELERRVQELEKRNSEMEQELKEAKEWEEKLENQATRLMEEKNSLKEQLAETENELDSLKESKERLAQSTNNTINELRGYLVKYQKAVMDANESVHTQ